jgi:hypothetical protein
MSTGAAKHAKRNEMPISCEITGCDARVHGHGLCRRHYDLHRYRERNGKKAGAKGDAWREMLVEQELRLGWVADFNSPPGAMECSMFSSEEERREAREERRERLMARWNDPICVGERPWAWWAYEAERPEYLTEYALDFEGPVDEHADLLDEWHNEPIIWLASHGHLSPEEVAAITEDANVARPRVGTDGEQIGSGGVDRVDVRAVKLYEALTDALKPNSPT